MCMNDKSKQAHIPCPYPLLLLLDSVAKVLNRISIQQISSHFSLNVANGNCNLLITSILYSKHHFNLILV